jgi:heat shock protein HslJ
MINVMKPRITLLILLLLSLVLSACQAVEDPGVPITGENDDDPLLGTEWLLERMYGEPVIEGSVVSAQFETQNDTTLISGLAGCNSYSGDYQVDGNQLNIGEIIATEMACEEPQGIMQQEQLYLQALRDEVTRYEVDGDRLWMINHEGETILEYRW